MSRLRLADADRERLGCPEYLPNPLESVTVREAMELQKLGYPSPVMLGRILRKGLSGSDEDGEPDYEAWVALIWLALRRVGVDCDPKELDFDLFGLGFAADEAVEPKAEPGKAPARGRSTNSTKKNSTPGATSGVRSTPTDSSS